MKTIHVRRIGDFYEAIGDDARRLSEMAGVTLTTRSNGVKLAGFPKEHIEHYRKHIGNMRERLVVEKCFHYTQHTRADLTKGKLIEHPHLGVWIRRMGTVIRFAFVVERCPGCHQWPGTHLTLQQAYDLTDWRQFVAYYTTFDLGKLERDPRDVALFKAITAEIKRVL